jgi:hypothetical protein
MPEIGFEGLSILLVLLPGFVTARIVQGLCVRPAQTELDKFVEALLYSFLVYVSYSFWRSQLPVYPIVQEHSDGSRIITPAVSPAGLLLLLGIGVLLGLIVSTSITNDLHGRLFRKVRATQRTTRSSIWSDVFHEMPIETIQFLSGARPADRK